MADMFPGEALWTLIQYLLLFGIVAVGYLPTLWVAQFRTRLSKWPTDRLAMNFMLLVGVIAVGQVIVVVSGWELLQIGSTKADPRFRGGRLFALLIGYPVAILGLGTMTGRLYYTRQSSKDWLTPRTIGGLSLATGWYILVLILAGGVLMLISLFFALPT